MSWDREKKNSLMRENRLHGTALNWRARLDSTREATIQPETPRFDTLSKRGARRVIQRALVLVGRNRAVRQNLRAVELNSLWMIEDLDLDWTVLIERGRPEFHRGRVGHPQVILRWRMGEDFFHHIESGAPREGSYVFEGEASWRRVIDTVFNAFAKALRTVLVDPVGDDGERLL